MGTGFILWVIWGISGNVAVCQEFDGLDINFCKCSLATVVIYSAEIHGGEFVYIWDKNGFITKLIEKAFFFYSPQAVMKAGSSTQLSMIFQLTFDSKWSSVSSCFTVKHMAQRKRNITLTNITHTSRNSNKALAMTCPSISLPCSL